MASGQRGFTPRRGPPVFLPQGGEVVVVDTLVLLVVDTLMWVCLLLWLFHFSWMASLPHNKPKVNVSKKMGFLPVCKQICLHS